jgi:molybdate transport repressor ModE-like protein
MATNLDPVDLSLLVNIKRTQSITGAARAINISLSAASTRIKKLEAVLNVQILHRESDGVRFTPAGQLILDHADLVLGSRQRLAEDLRQMTRSGSQVLRVRATSMLVTETLPNVIGVYRATHPNVVVEIQELTSESIIGAVRRGDADIGIAWTDGDLEGLIATPYCDEKLVLVTHVEHPFANRDEAWFSEALGYSFVGLGDFSTTHRLLSEGARSCKQHYDRRTVVGSFEAICCMVAARIGLGVVPLSAARRYSRTLTFRSIDLKDDWAVRVYKILQRSGELKSHAEKFIEILMSEQKPCPDIMPKAPYSDRKRPT